MWRASLRLQGGLFLCARLLSRDTETIMAEEVFPAMRLPSRNTETIMAEEVFPAMRLPSRDTGSSAGTTPSMIDNFPEMR